MQASEGLYGFFAGAFMQVIRIRKQNLRTRLRQFSRTDPAHGAKGRDGHKRRRLDHTVQRCQSTAASQSVACKNFESKSGGHRVRSDYVAREEPERSTGLPPPSGTISMASP